MTQFAGSEAAATTPGAALASARERLGLTVADVAGQMRISPRQVEAIEADRYQELPGAVFVRGFVRNYARLLKLDPMPLLHALEPALGQEAPLRAHPIAGAIPVPARRGRTIGWLGVLSVLVACVLGAGLYEYWRSQPREASVHLPATSPNQLEPPAKPGPPTEPAATATPPLAAQGEAPSSAEAATSEPAPPAAAEPQATPSAAATPGAAPGARAARLGIQFVQESWFEIRDREGNVAFVGTGPANSMRLFDVQTPASVIIGNAGGVRITYNDRSFDVAPHATRNIARFTLE